MHLPVYQAVISYDQVRMKHSGLTFLKSKTNSSNFGRMICDRIVKHTIVL